MKLIISCSAVIALLASFFASYQYIEGRYVNAAEDAKWKQSQEKRHMLEDYTQTSTLIRTLEDKEKSRTIKPEEKVLLDQLKIQQMDRMKQIMEKK